MRITTKGQVTIPKDVRKKLGIRPGDDVVFREEGPFIVLENRSVPPDSGRADVLAGFLAEIERVKHEGGLVPLGMPVDAYMEMVRGYGDDADDPGFKHHP